MMVPEHGADILVLGSKKFQAICTCSWQSSVLPTSLEASLAFVSHIHLTGMIEVK